MEIQDLFETPELLPQNVQDLLEEYGEVAAMEGDAYENCAKMRDELEKLGYTMDYGLDAEPYDLRKIEIPVKNSDIFKQVVASNIEMLANGINSEAFNYSILKIDKMQLTEAEVRKTAVDFFNYYVQKELTDRLNNKLF